MTHAIQPLLTTLNPEQVATFRERGFLHLPRAFAVDDARAMEAEIWRRLRECNGVEQDDPATWKRSWDGLKTVAAKPLFRRIATARLVGAIDDLIGRGNWTLPRCWNMIRVSPPKSSETPWSVPAEGWHADAGVGDGLMLFILYSQVLPQGGGTLVLEGVHRLLARFLDDVEHRTFPCRVQKQRFAISHPWLARLTDMKRRSARGLEFLREHRDSDGIPLRVCQVAGEPGDVILCPAEAYHNAPSHHEGAPRCLSIKGIRAHARVQCTPG